MNRVQVPQFIPLDTSGRPVANGYIYVGIPDTDPTVLANQKTLYIQQESGTITSVSQPIRTNAGGVPVYSGDPVTLLVDGNYSLRINNSSGSQVYYIPNVTYDEVIEPGNYYYPSSSATDQGITGSNNTIKHYVDIIGTNRATIFLRHDSEKEWTDYVFETSYNIPENIILEFENGARLATAPGEKTTIYSPANIKAQPNQNIFTGTGIATFTHTGNKYVEWWYNSGTYTDAFRNALTGGGVISLANKSYDIDSILYIWDGTEIQGNNASIINNINTEEPLFWFLGSNSSIENLNIVNTINNIGGYLYPSSNIPTVDSLGQIINTVVYGVNFQFGHGSNIIGYKNFSLKNINMINGDDTTNPIETTVIYGNIENVLIENWNIKGNFSVGVDAEWNGIVPMSPKNIVVRNCIFEGLVGSGHYAIRGSSANYSIENNIVRDVNCGVHVNLGDKGIETSSYTYAHKYNIANNTFTDVGIGVYIVMSRYDSPAVVNERPVINIENNLFYSASIHAIRIYGETKAGIKIDNNVFESTVGIFGSDITEGLIIENNTFRDIINNAVLLSSSIGSVVKDNFFHSLQDKAYPFVSINVLGLHTQACKDNKIIGNIFGNVSQAVDPKFHIILSRKTGASIWEDYPQNNIVADNHFYKTDTGYSVIFSAAINIADRYISKNFMYGNISYTSDVMFYGAVPFIQSGVNVETPRRTIATAPTIGTWSAGDIINTDPLVGVPTGWVCTVSGTFGGASAGGATTNESTVVAVANTSGFFVGQWVNATAGFATLTNLKVMSIVPNTSITVDRKANSSGAVILSTTDPTFVAFGNL